MERKKLTCREKTFCMRYLCDGDASKAARAAGYKKYPDKHAERLMLRQDIRDEILRLCEFKKETSRYLASIGLERIAFGGVSDAVSLLYLENPAKEVLEDMDLFCVSEIKKLKDGLMEIKFFDRLKAMGELSRMTQEKEQTAVSPVYEAILAGAAALKGEGDKK